MKMKKYFKQIISFLLAFSFVLALSGVIYTQTVNAQLENYLPSGVREGYMILKAGASVGASATVEMAATFVVNNVLKLVSLITGLGGVVLNGVVNYTVANVSQNYEKISSINIAWKTIRDIGNMGFIFVLLYAAITTILGTGRDNKSLIVRVIVVAILINFSLFFTKVVIDISNVLALAFYDAMVPGAAGAGISYGLSNAFMQYLDLTSLYAVTGGAGLGLPSILTIGVMGSILLLITAFVFFAVAIMFIIRYVVLIIVLILSPIAFLSFVLPEMKKYRDQWWNALSGQAFFAPIYFALTWITLQILAGIMGIDAESSPVFGTRGALSGVANVSISNAGVVSDGGFFSTLINFGVVIAFLIISLVIAKEWANKAGGGINKLTSWAGTAAGGVLGGGVGWVGRRTFGNLGKLAASNADLQTAAKDKSGFSGAAARLGLYAAKKVRSGTFDVRNATIPTSAVGAAVEGTIGRTKVGKAMGLDEVRIPSVAVGRFAADQTGAGKGGTEGALEEAKAKAKRIEIREKARDDEYREAVAKKAIADGTSATATNTQITEMQKIIKDMSAKEITALDHNTLANEKVAEALTAAHLKAIDEDKEGKFSESEKRVVFENHFAKVTEATRALTTNSHPVTGAALTADQRRGYQGVLRNISDKEIDYVPTSIFDPTKLDPATAPGPDGQRSRKFIETLTQPQIDNLTKGDKLIASEKQAVKDTRARRLNDAFAANNWSGTPDSAIEVMREMRPEALVQLEDTKLTNPNILELYSPPLLNKMAARSELTEAKALAIRTAIINAGPGGPGTNQQKSYDWLHGDGLNIF